MVANTKQRLRSLRWILTQEKIQIDPVLPHPCYYYYSECCLNNDEMSIYSIAKRRGGARQFLDLLAKIYISKCGVNTSTTSHKPRLPKPGGINFPSSQREKHRGMPGKLRSPSRRHNRAHVAPFHRPPGPQQMPKRGFPSRLEMTGQPQLPEITPTIRPILQSTQ